MSCFLLKTFFHFDFLLFDSHLGRKIINNWKKLLYMPSCVNRAVPSKSSRTLWQKARHPARHSQSKTTKVQSGEKRKVSWLHPSTSRSQKNVLQYFSGKSPTGKFVKLLWSVPDFLSKNCHKTFCLAILTKQEHPRNTFLVEGNIHKYSLIPWLHIFRQRHIRAYLLLLRCGKGDNLKLRLPTKHWTLNVVKPKPVWKGWKGTYDLWLLSKGAR